MSNAIIMTGPRPVAVAKPEVANSHAATPAGARAGDDPARASRISGPVRPGEATIAPVAGGDDASAKTSIDQPPIVLDIDLTAPEPASAPSDEQDNNGHALNIARGVTNAVRHSAGTTETVLKIRSLIREHLKLRSGTSGITDLIGAMRSALKGVDFPQRLVVSIKGLKEGDAETVLTVVLAGGDTVGSITLTVLESLKGKVVESSWRLGSGSPAVRREVKAVQLKMQQYMPKRWVTPPAKPTPLATAIKVISFPVEGIGVIWGVMDGVTGTISLAKASDADTRLLAGMQMVGGYSLAASSMAAIGVMTMTSFAPLGSVASVLLPVIGSGGAVIGFAAFAGLMALTVIQQVNASNNQGRAMEVHREWEYEARQMAAADARMVDRSKRIESEMLGKKGFRPSRIWINNNAADFINAVGSRGNSASGQWVAGPDGTRPSAYNPKYIHSANTHRPVLSLDMNIPPEGAAEAKGKAGVGAGGGGVDDPGGSAPQVTTSIAARQGSRGWKGSGPGLSKEYGYSTTSIGLSWKEKITQRIDAGSPYVSQSNAAADGAGNLLILDEMPVGQPAHPFSSLHTKRDQSTGGATLENQVDEWERIRTTKYELQGLPPMPSGLRVEPSTAGAAIDELISKLVNHAIDAHGRAPAEYPLPMYPGDTAAQLRAWLEKLIDAIPGGDKEFPRKGLRELLGKLPEEELRSSVLRVLELIQTHRGVRIADNHHLATGPIGTMINAVMQLRLSQDPKKGDLTRWAGESARQALERNLRALKDVSPSLIEEYLSAFAGVEDSVLDATFKACQEYQRMTSSLEVADAAPSKKKEVLEQNYPVEEGRLMIRHPDRYARQVITQRGVPNHIRIDSLQHDTSISLESLNDEVEFTRAPDADVAIRLAPVGGRDRRRLRVAPGVEVSGISYSEGGTAAVVTFGNGKILVVQGPSAGDVASFLGDLKVRGAP